eukprot:3639527-Alexandrium_andersonii.AAC.1
MFLTLTCGGLVVEGAARAFARRGSRVGAWGVASPWQRHVHAGGHGSVLASIRSSRGIRMFT